MYITKIEKVNKQKCCVYIDEVCIGAFYLGEIKRFRLKEGNELNAQELENINRVLYQRAKERALFLIQKAEQTTGEIRKKLKRNYYTDDMIEKVIDFLKEYKFVDDERYIQQYISFKEKKYSIRVMKEKLLQKGVSKELLDSIVEKQDNHEEELILRIIEKKQKNRPIVSYEERNKLIQHLLYKGFSYSMVKEVVEKYQKKQEYEAEI